MQIRRIKESRSGSCLDTFYIKKRKKERRREKRNLPFSVRVKTGNNDASTTRARARAHNHDSATILCTCVAHGAQAHAHTAEYPTGHEESRVGPRVEASRAEATIDVPQTWSGNEHVALVYVLYIYWRAYTPPRGRGKNRRRRRRSEREREIK